MSLLLLLKSAAGGATPQTWTGTAGTISVAGSNGTFTPSTPWTGNAGTITITGSSGAWTASAQWTGNNATILIIGTSNGFAGVTTSTGTPHGGEYHPISFGIKPEQDDQLALILALI